MKKRRTELWKHSGNKPSVIQGLYFDRRKDKTNQQEKMA